MLLRGFQKDSAKRSSFQVLVLELAYKATKLFYQLGILIQWRLKNPRILHLVLVRIKLQFLELIKGSLVKWQVKLKKFGRLSLTKVRGLNIKVKLLGVRLVKLKLLEVHNDKIIW